jgi:transposase
MTERLIEHERIDDVPLIIAMARQLKIDQIIDKHLGRHGSHEGLSSGLLAVGWLGFILSEGDHAKSHVQDWSLSLRDSLSALLGQEIKDTDFSDDRLTILLRHFANADWLALDTDIWGATLEVYDLPVQTVRHDSTTASGHHQLQPRGLMQFGPSKDDRPDLPQFKLMGGAVQPAGLLLTAQVHPGNAADDPLYIPLITGVRSITGKRGLLHAGDCKMAALGTRAFVVSGDDYYLCRLPRSKENAPLIDSLVEQVLDGTVASSLLKEQKEKETVVLGRACEITRTLSAEVDDPAKPGQQKTIEWQERVQLIRPHELWQRHQKQLEERLVRAQRDLKALTPPPTRGKRQIREEEELIRRAKEVLAEHKVEGLLGWSYERQETIDARKETRVRYQITKIERDEKALKETKERLSWLTQVTNLDKERLDLLGCVLSYREGHCLEQDWHLVKNRPLGLTPLWLSKDEQIKGLVWLLSVALRLLTLIQMQVRKGLDEEKTHLQGTFPGQPGRRDKRPTTYRLLRALGRITLTVTRSKKTIRRELSCLPELLPRLLCWLKLPAGLYSDLAADRPRPSAAPSFGSLGALGPFALVPH